MAYNVRKKSDIKQVEQEHIKASQLKFHLIPSQDLQAPHCIQVYPPPTSSPKDFSCFDLQLDETIPMIHMHLIFLYLTMFQSIATMVGFAQLEQEHSANMKIQFKPPVTIT